MQLSLIETEEAYLVVFDNNPDDWIARFSKENGFPAREWAERMIREFQEKNYPKSAKTLSHKSQAFGVTTRNQNGVI